MSISKLATHIIPADDSNYSANRSRYSPIKEITVHHMAGNMRVEQLGKLWQNPSRNGSSHYGVNGSNIASYVSEGDVAWTNSNFEANCRAVTIETANCGGAPSWPVSDETIKTLIELVADIAQRNGLGKLIPKQNLTMHKQYSATACPGPYLESQFEYIAEQANIINGYGEQVTPEVSTDEKTFIDLLVPLVQEDQRQNKILASLTLAQAILECDYGRSELAQNANNMFGIKHHDSFDIYNKETSEYVNGEYVRVTLPFCKYKSTKECIQDHADKLSKGWAAENCYKGVVGETDITKAVNCIKKWATAPDYVEKLLNVAKKWDLTQYDLAVEVEELPSELDILKAEKAEWEKEKIELNVAIIDLKDQISKLKEVLADINNISKV